MDLRSVEAVMRGRELHWKSDGKEIQLRVEEHNGTGSLSIDNREFSFSVLSRNESGGWFTMNGRNYQFFVHQNQNEFVVWIEGRTYRLDRIRKGGRTEEVSTR